MEPALGPLRVQPPEESTVPASRLRRWFLPDLAMAASLLTLFYCAFLFEGYWKLFRDSDTGWHIRNGESMLSSGWLPRVDPYSFSRAGQPWYAWEWAADAGMGLAHRTGGMQGVAALYLTAIAVCTWLWFRLHWAAGGDFLLACALASPMLSTVNLHWLARPHVFGWLLLMIAVLAAERAPERFRLRHYALAAALAAAWANVHASFFLAPAVALVYAAHHLARPWLWELDAPSERRRAASFARAAAAAMAGTFVNPYGWRLHQHIARYLADTDLLARVGEFQSFNFHAEGSAQILLALSVATAGGVLALSQRNIAHFLLAAGLLAIALRSARGLPVAALVLLPLANGAITTAWRRARAVRAGVRSGIESWLDYSGKLRRIDAGMRGLALAPLAVAAIALVLPDAGFPASQFPVAAAGEVAKLPGEARLLAPDRFGGYLIYRFAGQRKVFFDGRSDFYGAGFMKDYIRLVQVRPGWKQQVDAFGFTHALLPADYSLVAALEREGWRRTYEDKTAVLLRR